MKKCLISIMFLVICLGLFAQTTPGLRVNGRFLYDHLGEKVILVGVNKMIIWTDIDGLPSYPEIAKTNANCVRIVWGISGTAVQLEAAIFNCRSYDMIPIPELHDATGDWSKLQSCVDYWCRSDIVEVIQRHQQYLIINIANECGQTVADADYRAGYESAVNQMRNAGIHVPIMIDAPSYGQGIDSLQANGPYLISKDPDQNLLFSVHMWWPYCWGYTDQRVIDEIAESVNMNLPLVVGEFGNKWDTSGTCDIPYLTIIDQCTANQIGWLPWSWGPGNNPQTWLDMTTDSTYATLYDWGLIAAVSHTNSIKNTAKKPASLTSLDPVPTPTPVPVPDGDLALNRPVTVSSTESTSYAGSYAVDGDTAFTRWASVSGSDPQYLSVDLGASTTITRVILYWEAAFATQYKIQTSEDQNTWTDVYTEYNGNGGTDDLTVSGTGRYVRMYGTQRTNSSWGYSLWEMAVYGSGSVTAGPTTAPTADPTTPPVDTTAPTDVPSTPGPTDSPTDTPAPTATPGPTAIPTATPYGVTVDPTTPPGDTAVPTNPPADTAVPTNPPSETTAPGTCTCTNLCSSTTAITVPFTYDGAGEFCWTSSSLGSYVNSWNADAVNINGTSCTNTYVASSSITAINGVYYIYYKASYSWSHIEIK